MASVYVARLRGAEGFQRAMAIKVLRREFANDRTYQAMFVDEARIAAQLTHPNVVHVYELGRDEGDLYLAMELLLGRSLKDIWAECRARGLRLRGDVVAWLGARVAEALHHAHELSDIDGTPQRLVHRDVNPANVFVTFDGHVKLLDFGLVHGKDRLSKTETGIIKGKVAYMSPEQTLGSVVDRRSDIFSLGATIWELSTDRRLFVGETDVDTLLRIRDAIVDDPTQFIPGYSSLLWLVLRRALARDPVDRYQAASDLARDLDGVARAEGSILQAATMGEILFNLFGAEREREIAWVKEMAQSPQPDSQRMLMPATPSPQARSAPIRSPYLVETAPPILTTRAVAIADSRPEPSTALRGRLRRRALVRAAGIAVIAMITLSLTVVVTLWASH
jgi:serine/threonine protein kinase